MGFNLHAFADRVECKTASSILLHLSCPLSRLSFITARPKLPKHPYHPHLLPSPFPSSSTFSLVIRHRWVQQWYTKQSPTLQSRRYRRCFRLRKYRCCLLGRRSGSRFHRVRPLRSRELRRGGGIEVSEGCWRGGCLVSSEWEALRWLSL